MTICLHILRLLRIFMGMMFMSTPCHTLRQITLWITSWIHRNLKTIAVVSQRRVYKQSVIHHCEFKHFGARYCVYAPYSCFHSFYSASAIPQQFSLWKLEFAIIQRVINNIHNFAKIVTHWIFSILFSYWELLQFLKFHCISIAKMILLLYFVCINIFLVLCKVHLI